MSSNRIVNVERTLKPAAHITGFIQYHMRGGRKRGVLCAQYDHQTRQFRIGWSLCAKNRGDTFNPVYGREMALNRMVIRTPWQNFDDFGVSEVFLGIPVSLEKDFQTTIQRLSLIHNVSLRNEEESKTVAGKARAAIGNMVSGIASAVMPSTADRRVEQEVA